MNYNIGIVSGTALLCQGKYLMYKRLLIDSLIQHFTQIEISTETQLSELLERLESQKVRLPKGDHSIVDWGISFVRNKIQEEMKIMEELLTELDFKYKNYNTFVQGKEFPYISGTNFCPEVDWTSWSSSLSTQPTQTKLYHSFIDRLNVLIVDAVRVEVGGRNGMLVLEEYVPYLKQYLSTFSASVPGLNKHIFKYCADHFQKLSAEPKVEHSSYYRKLASALISD
ncbi:hypothetical protein [Leptolyngbya sp. GGD]|uniref:hypothetical protein n=1 Tax=Leptolyngbya sp. GGD TaxID=2997907 RepID=UPI00227ADBB2|nr:hypothetical protein [Leptolyngbya sp. GGD]MCY6494394.1 hypothetical protein [Leptolyngbya sp. GGD]